MKNYTKYILWRILLLSCIIFPSKAFSRSDISSPGDYIMNGSGIWSGIISGNKTPGNSFMNNLLDMETPALRLPISFIPTSASFTKYPVYPHTPIAISTSDFPYTNRDGTDDGNLSYVLIVDAPVNGSLWVDSDGDNNINGSEIPVLNNTPIPKNILDAGKLKYLTTINTSASFTFRVSDNFSLSTSTYVATLSVVPIPTVSFSSESQSSSSEEGTLSITAQLSAPFQNDVSIPFTVNGSSTATGGGTDYTLSSSPLTVPTGTVSASITLSIATDNLDENNETVIVDMGTPTYAILGTTTSHTATITDDDYTPVITPSQSLSVVETNSGDIGYIAATDADPGTIFQNWSIITNVNPNLNGNNAFSINPTNGMLSVNDPDDLIAGNIHNLGITVSDGINTSSETTVNVTVTTANSAPVITSPLSVNVYENVKDIQTLTASDPDGDLVLYSISGGADKDFFQLTGNSSLSFLNTRDFERAEDSDRNNTYLVEITASDPHNAKDSETITVHVLDRNEPPIIKDQTFTIPENMDNDSSIGRILCIDPECNTLSYAMINPEDSTAFRVDENTGEIFVEDSVWLDYESRDTILFEINVADNIQTSRAVITVLIEDLNDEIPVINPSQSFDIMDTTTFNTVIDTIKAHDRDAKATAFQNWILVTNVNPDEDEEPGFSVDDSTGILRVNDTGDLVAGAVYNLGLTVSDGVNTSLETMVSVQILDSNADPVITCPACIDLNENMADIVTVTSDDPDEDEVELSISGGADQNFFSITADGKLSFTSARDFENPGDSDHNNTYLVEITATDNKNGEDTQSLTVNILDINEAPVVSDQTFRIQENLANDRSIGTILAEDPESMSLIFSMTGEEASSAFTMDEVTGELKVKDAAWLDYEIRDTLSFEIQVADTSLMSSAEVSIVIENVNDNAPNLLETVFSLDENPDYKDVVGILEAEDADGWVLTDTIIIEILEGNEDSVFGYNPATMELWVNKEENIDYEVRDTFLLKLRISDGILFTDTPLIIKINDVDENTSAFSPETAPLKLYPNPANNYLIVEFAENSTLSIFNIDGKLIHKEESEERLIHINTSRFKDGTYFLYIKAKDKTYVEKFVITR